MQKFNHSLQCRLQQQGLGLFFNFNLGFNSSINLKTLLLCFMVIGYQNLHANNLHISNVDLTNHNTSLKYTNVVFDVSWDNSWRVVSGPSNWDAAWIFIKYRIKNQTTWHHATLNWVDGSGSGDGHTEPANTNIASSNDNGAGGSNGVFIYRSSPMAQGSVNYTGVKLRWNYGVDGVSDTDKVEVCVLGVEMVYVPEGKFVLGSGGSENGAFFSFPSTIDTYEISSENAIPVDTFTGNLYYTTSGDQQGPIPAAYPKGYQAYYCMKYELSQAQYVAFLNKLTSRQASYRISTSSTLRNGITGTVGSFSTSLPFVACNFLDWADLTAYLDWAALRPMSEFEYEKSARGNLNPVVHEYAWGTTGITGATGISNPGLNNETPSNSGANCAYGNAAGVQGPLRGGCFGQGINTRATTGAGYYGIMELSGNLFERIVSIGGSIGRGFDGLNGDGEINSVGDADVFNWPGRGGGGAGFRGGNWNRAAVYQRVSDRFYSNNTNGDRSGDFGGRGCRTAP